MFGNIDTQKVACGVLALGAAWYFGVPTAIANALSTTTAALAVNATAAQAVNATAANALSATAAAQAVQTTLIGVGGFAAANAFGRQNNHGPLSAGVTQSGDYETTQATRVSDEQAKAELQLILDKYNAKSYIAPKECRYFGSLLKSIKTFEENPIDECNTEQFLREVDKFGIDNIKSPQQFAAIYFRLTLEKDYGSADYQKFTAKMRKDMQSSPKLVECIPYLNQLIARMNTRITELEKAVKEASTPSN